MNVTPQRAFVEDLVVLVVVKCWRGEVREILESVEVVVVVVEVGPVISVNRGPAIYKKLQERS